MAFGDTIQSKRASGASGEVAITFDATATLGNLLILMEGRGATHTAGGAWGPPAGWDVIHDSGINVGNMAGAMYYKISDGTETAFVTSHTNESSGWQCGFAEFEGPFAVSPLDVSAESIANLSTIVTSQTTGTTGATSQNDELAVAGWAADAFGAIDASRAYTNSFSEVIIADISSARATAIIAKKILSSIGAVECTFSCVDTGDEMYGTVATFKKAGGGGPVSIVLPIFRDENQGVLFGGQVVH